MFHCIVNTTLHLYNLYTFQKNAVFSSEVCVDQICVCVCVCVSDRERERERERIELAISDLPESKYSVTQSSLAE